MKQELVKKAIEVLAKREREANDIARQNLDKALKDKDFAKVYAEYTSLLPLVAQGTKSEDTLVAKKKELDACLKKLSISSIEPDYSCKKCDDSGFIDGRYCSCLKQEISKILIKNSGFSSLNDFSKSNFDIFSNKEEIKKIYSLMEKWCKSGQSKNLVYLLGNTGTGKTFLTSCMAKEFICQGKIVYMTTAFNLSQDFLKFHRSFDNAQKASVFENYLDTEVLFIDDLGTEPVYNNVTREYLYLLLNERRTKGLRTIITSNLEPFDLRERYDERIFSRIVDKEHSIVLKLDSVDVRVKKA